MGQTSIKQMFIVNPRVCPRVCLFVCLRVCLAVFCFVGLSRLPQAEKYLSQAQWLMLKTLSCDNSVKCLVFRQLGLLYTAQGQYEKARLTLADDV